MDLFARNPSPRHLRPRTGRLLAALVAGGVLLGTACTDDQTGTHDDDGQDPAFTGENGPPLEGTAPPPGDDPSLPGDGVTPDPGGGMPSG